jgi:hypothetical protein
MSSSFRNRAWSAGYFGKGGWRGEQLHKDCSSLQNSKVNRQPFPQHSSLLGKPTFIPISTSSKTTLLRAPLKRVLSWPQSWLSVLCPR